MVTAPKRKRLKIERHVSASLLKSIGLLMVTTSTMESILANTLLRLIGTSRAGARHAFPLVTGMDFIVKISLIRIFTKMYSLSRAKQINKVLDEINKLFGVRNTIAHSLLIPTEKKDLAKFQDLRAKIKLGEPRSHH
jgi:hypothetical protein